VRIVAPAVASYSALPEPMFARSGQLPTSGDYAYEVKWDGFRAVVSKERAHRGASQPAAGGVVSTGDEGA
jgi:ATP-dependent DNA ligase